MTFTKFDPHAMEGKIWFADATRGIFHRRSSTALGATRCGLVIADNENARRTDHRLADWSPCVVCFPPDPDLGGRP